MTTNLWVDALAIGIIIIFALSGLIKGFYKTAVGLIGNLLSLGITYLITGPIAASLLGIDTVNAFVHGPLFGISELLKATGADVTKLATLVFTILVFFATFLIVRLLMMIVTVVLKSLVDKDKKKSGLGRLLGFGLGGVSGALLVVIILVIGTMFSNMMPVDVRDALYGDASITGKHVGSEIKVRVDRFIDENIGDIFGNKDNDEDEDEDQTPDVQTELEAAIDDMNDRLGDLIDPEWALTMDSASMLATDPDEIIARYWELDAIIIDTDYGSADFATFLNAYLNSLPSDTVSQQEESLQTIESRMAQLDAAIELFQEFKAAVNADADYDAISSAFDAYENAVKAFTQSFGFSS